MKLNKNKLKLQREAVKLFNSEKGNHLLLEWVTGSSKTKAAIDCIKSKYKEGESICFISFRLSGRDALKEEVVKWWPDHPEITWRTYAWYNYLRSSNDKLFNFDYVILDEAHHLSDSNFRNGFQQNFGNKLFPKWITTLPKNLILLSATIGNTIKYFPDLTIMRNTLNEAVKDKIVSDYVIIPKEFIPSEEQRMKVLKIYNSHKNSFGFNPIAYNSLLSYLANLKEKKCIKFIQSLEGKTLVFCANIAQARRVSKHAYHSKSYKTVKGKKVEKYPGSDKESKENLKLFNEGKIRVLSSVNALDESVNISELDNIVILQGNGNKRKLIQRIGRVVRFRENHIGNVYYHYVKGTIDESWYKKHLV